MKKIVGYIQIIVGGLFWIWGLFRLRDLTENASNTTDWGFNIPAGAMFGDIKVIILVLCILIILQGIVNIRKKG